MNVVHVITRMILGGAMENTLLTCEGLHQRGHKVRLISGPALGPEGELMTRAKAGGYEVLVLDDFRREINLKRDWRVYRQLRDVLAPGDWDIVHTHASKAGIIGRRAAMKVRRGRRGPPLDRLGTAPRPTRGGPELAEGPGKMKIVHTIHGLPFHPYANWLVNRAYIALERQAARYTDALISVCDAMTQKALAAGVGDPQQYTTIYSGMEVEGYLADPPGVVQFRASLGLGADDVLVTQVARLAELKGHEYILQAAGAIKEPRVHFCFVGDGARRGWIEREIARLGLGKRVHLTGLLPPERIPTVMRASDIVVHCSLREGLARALPQAMLAGVPVVSFDIDGAREVVDADTGILLEPGDVPGLKLAIETLAQAPALRTRLGAEGRRRATARFDWRAMVERIEGVYKKLIG